MTDVFSWGDSSPEDPFDDDSWMSEPESICNNWRGWKKITPPNTTTSATNGIMASNSHHHRYHHHHHPHHHHIQQQLNLNYPGANGISGSSNATTSEPSTSGTSTLRHQGITSTIQNNALNLSSYSHNRSENGDHGSSLPSNHNQHLNPNSLIQSSSYSAAVYASSEGSNNSNQSGNFLSEFSGIQGDQSCCSVVPSLTELSARAVAYHISFEVVERVCSPVPEQLQLRIAYWSFPDNEEDIRLYSCLANGSADEFQKGETLYRCRSVQCPLQIGFHLSATVVSASTKTCTVAVTFDRCRITSCNCTCASPSSWCSHVVAVCLHRIYQPNTVRLRAPVSESLTRLSRDQLQKFAQYLISESPQQILPTAQRLLDDLLLNENSDINKVRGAPDPTAGAPASEQTKWCLDELQLHGNIRKIVIKLCIPSPMVYSDVNYLSSAAPPAAAEWSSLLRPLRGREPEGLWNLLSIVREMLRRHDRNAIPLLRILTEELLSCDQILIWWFSTNVSLHRGYPPNNSSHHGGGGSNGSNAGGGSSSSNNRSMHSNIYASQHACCSLCDEIVVLWRLVTLNPAHSYLDTQTLYHQLKEYHLKTLSVIHRFKPSSSIVYNHQNYRPSTSMTSSSSIVNSNTTGKLSDLEIFSGFKPAMVSSLVDWDSYPIPGVTHQRKNHRYYEPSLHDQLNSVNHAITSTVISLRLDSDILWSSKSTDHQMYHQQSDQFSDTNSSGENKDCGSQRGIKKKSISTDGNSGTPNNNNQRNKDNESEDSGNQEFWERFSIASSDNDDNNNSNGNVNDPGPSGLSSSLPANEHRSSREEMQENRNISNEGNNGGNHEVLHEDYQIYIYNNDDLHKVKNVGNNNGQDNNQENQNGVGGNIQAQNSGDYEWEPVLLQATMVKPIEDPFEILFARAEALYAHGYVEEACRLSVRLAEELLSNPPDLQVDLNNNNNQNDQQSPNLTSSTTITATTMTAQQPSSIQQPRSSHTKRINRNRFNPALHQISLLTSATLSKAAFLCQVLSENEDSHLLAFHVGLFGLELVRPPASTKALEVKLAHQEQELVNLLKRIPLCQQALYVLREKAEQLRDGRLTTRGEALLPLSLASYIFEALLLSNQIMVPHFRLPTDERLVFDAAVAAIGLKAKVSEAEHPLLCEGTRRQRGDLALQLLVHYKDNKQRLDLIMEKLLDQEIHPIFNNSKKQQQSSSSNIYVSHSHVITSTTTATTKSSSFQAQAISQNTMTKNETTEPAIVASSTKQEPATEATAKPTTTSNSDQTTVWNLVDEFQQNLCVATSSSLSNAPMPETVASDSIQQQQDNNSSAPDTTSSDNSPTVSRRNIFHKSGKANSGSESSSSSSSSSSGGGESSSSSSSSDLLSTTSDTKKSSIHHPNESASDQVVVDATSSLSNGSMNTGDSNLFVTAFLSKYQNSKRPYTATSATGRHLGAGSPSTTIMTPVGCTTSTALGTAAYPSIGPSTSLLASSTYQLTTQAGTGPSSNNNTSGHSQSFKPLRYKGKRHYPVIPNQPSEASAHFMFELAKTLLAKAGGNNTTVLFTQPPSSQNCRAPHRLLHMCAFQIGLYALGLHNAVSPNWLSRTYSSHVSWITCQAMEIGHQAIEFLIDTWEGHLTPSEVASLADRASRSQEPLMVKAAAELALSCLPHAHALTPSEIQRALIQCKEQSRAMLERACLAVEQAAQGGGVYPEVLFDVARKWYQLYVAEKVIEIEERRQTNTNNDNISFSDTDPQPSASAITTSVSEPLDSMAINTIQQEFYDPTSQQSSFGSSQMVEQNVQISSPYSTAIPHHHHHHHQTNFYQTQMLQPSLQNPYQPDMNQYMFIQQRTNSFQQRPHKINGSSQPKPPTLAQYYHHRVPPPPSQLTVLFDPQRGYYLGNQNGYPLTVVATSGTPPPISSSLQPTTQLRACAASYNSTQYYSSPLMPSVPSSGGAGTGTGAQIPVSTQSTSQINQPSPMFPSNGNYFYPIANSTQQLMTSGPPGSSRYSFTAPLSVVRAQLGFIPQGLVATQATTPTGQTIRLLSMEQLAQQLQASNVANTGSFANQPSGGTGSTHYHHNHHHHHHHHHHHQHQHHHHMAQTILGPRQLGYMHAAYRVGMLAMDTLARRVYDDRPQARYARNPSYGEDVKWLLFIAKKLGSQFVQEFCLCTLTAVASPFVLYDIILEASQSIFQSASNNTAYIQTIRSQILTPLIQKCQQMFTSCIYFQIMHITSSDYDEFIATLRTARAAYQMTPGGNIPFNDLLQSLKRTKTCKKELWQQITNAMQSS